MGCVLVHPELPIIAKKIAKKQKKFKEENVETIYHIAFCSVALDGCRSRWKAIMNNDLHGAGGLLDKEMLEDVFAKRNKEHGITGRNFI